jgi:hypothetical protein
VEKTRDRHPVLTKSSSRNHNAKVRRLVIRPGAIGDLVLSLPALEHLEPDEVWTAGPNVPLIRFAAARSIASTGLDLVGIMDPPARLLEELAGFDSIISWYGANRPDFQAEVERLALPFTFFPALPAADSQIHATDFYLQQVSSIARCDSDDIPQIRCATKSADYAIIHPFSGSPRKNWPLEKYRALAARLERVMPVRWCAGDDDPPLPDSVRIADLYELACWLAGARLYIGNDSGITHLAAAAGAPVLAVFGPTDPVIWGPRGPNVRIVRTQF